MKSLRVIFISILLFGFCIYLISSLGTQIYINNFGELSTTDVNKLSKLSVEVGYIEQNLTTFGNGTKELQTIDVSNVKEYIAEFLDTRSTVQQFVSFLKQAYRGGDIILMAFPFDIYSVFGDFFLSLYRAFFVMVVTVAIFVAIRGGDVVNG
ncbi:MAG: hypothetical protein R6V14_04555 [Halanaerobiales bacterium]